MRVKSVNSGQRLVVIPATRNEHFKSRLQRVNAGLNRWIGTEAEYKGPVSK